MPKVRKIPQDPPDGCRHGFLVDANFMAMKYIPEKYAPNDREKERIASCAEWWAAIDDLVNARKATVYIPDVCIAESFKVLAKKYFEDKWFPSPQVLGTQRKKLSSYISLLPKDLKSANRNIRVHDVESCRDIIIGVDRFYELFMKQGKKVQIADLILVSTAKYLMDFYSFPKNMLHIVTLDRPLLFGIAKVTELPNAYDPTQKKHRAELVFDG